MFCISNFSSVQQPLLMATFISHIAMTNFQHVPHIYLFYLFIYFWFYWLDHKQLQLYFQFFVTTFSPPVAVFPRPFWHVQKNKSKKTSNSAKPIVGSSKNRRFKNSVQLSTNDLVRANKQSNITFKVYLTHPSFTAILDLLFLHVPDFFQKKCSPIIKRKHFA